VEVAQVTAGSRGDVAPYLALGEAQAARGRAVRLLAPEGFDALFTGSPVRYRPVGPEPRSPDLSSRGAGLAFVRERIRAYERAAPPSWRAWSTSSKAPSSSSSAASAFPPGTGPRPAGCRRCRPFSSPSCSPAPSPPPSAPGPGCFPGSGPSAPFPLLPGKGPGAFRRRSCPGRLGITGYWRRSCTTAGRGPRRRSSLPAFPGSGCPSSPIGSSGRAGRGRSG